MDVATAAILLMIIDECGHVQPVQCSGKSIFFLTTKQVNVTIKQGTRDQSIMSVMSEPAEFRVHIFWQKNRVKPTATITNSKLK